MAQNRTTAKILDHHELDRAMRKNGITNRSLAEYSGCSASSIGLLRSGQRRTINREYIGKIAEALATEPSKLFDAYQKDTSTSDTPFPVSASQKHRRQKRISTPLSDYLAEAHTDGTSIRSLAAKANELGFDVSPAAFQFAFQGRTGKPSPNTLMAIAAVLDVNPDKLFQLADIRAGAGNPYHPPAIAERLTEKQRKAVDQIIYSLVEP